MSVTMTKELREEIVERVMDHGFSKRKAEMLQRQIDLGEEVYRSVISVELEKVLVRLPDDMRAESGMIQARPQGYYVNLKLAQRRPLADGGSVIPEGALAKKVIAFAEDERALDGEVYAREREVKLVLKSVKTLKRLIEVWPEVESLIADLNVVTRVTALARPIKELNFALGLPPDEQPAVKKAPAKKKAVARVG